MLMLKQKYKRRGNMFELDERFFDEIGVNRMPEKEREEFKKHIQDERN